MNLTSMMKDDSLANLQWLNNKETYEPQGKDTDQKDDLAIEWGRGDVSSEDRPHTNIQNEMKVKNTIIDVDTLLDYAQVLLHQGITKEETMRQVKLRFPSETIDAAGEQLTKILKLEGIVGSVVIDLRRTKRPAAIIQAAMKSPYHRHIAYVLMRKSDAENSGLVARKKQACTCSMDSGSIDGFMGNTETESESGMYYKPLDLPVITSCGDLDAGYYDSTIVDLVNTSGLAESEAKDIYLASGSAWMKLKKAFRIVNRRRLAHNAPSVNVVDNSADYKVSASQMEIQVAKEVTKKALNVDAAFAVTGPASDIMLNDSIDSAPQMDLDGMSVQQDIAVDGALPGAIDVDEATFVEEEFEGSDAFDLDDIKTQRDLEVNPEADIEV